MYSGINAIIIEVKKKKKKARKKSVWSCMDFVIVCLFHGKYTSVWQATSFIVSNSISRRKKDIQNKEGNGILLSNAAIHCNAES